MTPSQFEFLGKDRYFKYRYTQETPINVTTIEETWMMENPILLYNIMEEYLKRSFNMKASFKEHEIDYLAASLPFTNPEYFNDVNMILMPLFQSFFHGREEYFSPSPVFETARLIIVSGPPKTVWSTSFSLLNMDTNVFILVVSTVVILSLLLVIHSIVTNKYKSLPTKKVVKKLARETLDNVWENASLLCAEPIPAILPHITCRLLASSWLIGVTFILFFLGCYLRTEFTTESYNTIDTLSDLIKSGIPPTVIAESRTHQYLKLLAAEDPVIGEWLNTFDQGRLLRHQIDFFGSYVYTSILSGENALITDDTHLLEFLGELLTYDYDADTDEAKKLLLKERGLYISQQEIAFDYLHLVLNTSWMRSSSQLHEALQLSLAPLFETQVLKHLNMEMHYLIDKVTWKKPLKSTAGLDLSSVFVPFYLLFILMSGTAVVVFAEIFFYHFA